MCKTTGLKILFLRVGIGEGGGGVLMRNYVHRHYSDIADVLIFEFRCMFKL